MLSPNPSARAILAFLGPHHGKLLAVFDVTAVFVAVAPDEGEVERRSPPSATTSASELTTMALSLVLANFFVTFILFSSIAVYPLSTL